MRSLSAFLIVLFFATTQPAAAQPSALPPQKVLHYAFDVAETTMDPAKAQDIYSRYLTGHIFEGLFGYDPLARPVKTTLLLAAEMPVATDDFKTWTIRIKPGVYFADDPAFKGRKREVVAEDFVYVLKRFADPATKSPSWPEVEQTGYLGLAELREEALRTRRPLDYDKPIPGARALDRYTLQLRLAEGRPRMVEKWTGGDLYGAQAREVVEFYGDRIDEHPVGSGPFRLVSWRRGSRIVLERNPGYRERVYESQPAADDAEGQALLAKFKGRRLPMIDRVEISIVDEQQPRWLSFLNGQADFILRMSSDYVETAVPNGQLAPNLAKQGMQAYQVQEPGGTYTFFNMKDPLVGGYTPEKVALRRAIALGLDTPRLIRLVYKNLGLVAQSPLSPGMSGYSPTFRSEIGDYDPARAKALLDLYGYVDRDGDGWRELPDGRPLVLNVAAQPDQRSHTIDELTKKNMDALGIRMVLDIMQWPEALKRARAGSLTMWSLAGLASEPDGMGALDRYDSNQLGGQNMAFFSLPEMDKVLARLRGLPDGPERLALFGEAQRLAVAYMPYKPQVNRVSTDMAQRWLIGYRRPMFVLDWWEYVDIDASLRR